MTRTTGAVAALLLAAATAQADVPRTLGYQGRLLKADGNPVNGVTEISFAIYPAVEGGGTRLWTETQRVLLSDGYYAVNLGDITPIPDAVFDQGERYLEITVGGEALMPRQRFSSVAFAIRAGTANAVSGGPVNATSIAINGVPVIDSTGHLANTAAYQAGAGITIDAQSRTIGLSASCQNGEVLKKSGSGWVCGPDIGNAYSAGAGLQLSDNTFALTTKCAAGQILKWNGADWACAADQNPNYAAGDGLAMTGNTFGLTKECASGEILKFDGTTWACAADLNANYRAGSGIAIGGGTVSLTKSCISGEILKYDGAQWVCAPDEDTKVQQGAGITLTGSVVSLKKGCAAGQMLKWDGTTWDCADDDDTRYLAGSGLALDGKTLSLSKDCTLGQILKWDGAKWACTADKDSTYAAGSGLVLDGSTFGLLNTCKTGEMLKWDGAKWACAADRDTTYLAGTGLELNASNAFTLMTSCAAGQLLKWDGAKWACAGDTDTVATAAPNGGLVKNAFQQFSLDTSCKSGEMLKWNGAAWACAADVDTTYTAVADGGLEKNGTNGFSLLSSCTAGQVLKYDGTKWACAAAAVATTVTADSSGTVVVGGTAPNLTVATDPKKVQARVTGTCPAGTVMNGINEDGTVACTGQDPVIRWAQWSTYDQAYGWMASDTAALFGGVNPSTWGDSNGMAYQMSNTADSMRTLFNKKLSVNGNLNVMTDTWYYYSSTNSRHTGVLMRIKNSTAAAISFTPCFYYTAYSGYGEYASASINGANTWNSATGYGSSTACPTFSVPASRTSTVIIISASSPPSGTRTNTLIFYNNSLNLPTGLSYVDDLGSLAASTNIWQQ